MTTTVFEVKRSIIFSTVLLAGCAALPTIQSLPYTNESVKEYQGYDKTSSIRYQVSDDHENLYLTFNTAESASMMKILHGGLTIYFDEKGKKHEDIYLQYPLPQAMERPDMDEQQNSNSATRQRPESGTDGEQSERPEPPMMPISTEMLWVKNEETLTLDNNSENIGISVKITRSRDELTYELKIPIREILVEEINVSELSVGVASGELEAPSGGPQGGMPPSGGGGPGGSGGGRPPMGGGGGMPPGGGGMGTQGGSSSQSSSSSKIDFWFLVEL